MMKDKELSSYEKGYNQAIETAIEVIKQFDTKQTQIYHLSHLLKEVR